MVELVWDAREQGTGRSPSGASLRVGDATTFTPEDLLGLAAASCLMRSFVALARRARVPLLSYLATAEVEPTTTPNRSRIRVRVYLTAANEPERRQLQQLAARAQQHSPVACLLGDRVCVDADFRVIDGARTE